VTHDLTEHRPPDSKAQELLYQRELYFISEDISMTGVNRAIIESISLSVYYILG